MNRTQWKSLLGGLAGVTAMVLIAGCAGTSTSNSSSSSTSSSSEVSSLVPSMALSSPSISSKGLSSARVETNGRLIESDTAAISSTTTVTGSNDLKTLSAAKTEISEILAKSKDSDCFSGVKFKAFSKSVSCYGPELVYQNHPGGSGPAGGSPSCPPGASCLPTGDLGIWSATEGADSEACSVAQVNALVGDVASYVNNGIKLMAGMACLLKVKSKTMPTSGTSLTLATEMQSSITGSTITVATVSRESTDSGSNPVYKVVVQGSIDGNAISVTLRHSPATTGDFKGKIYGTVAVNSTSNKAFSVSYEQSGSGLRYLSRMANFATSTATVFDSAGTMTLSGFNSDARYLVGNVDKDSGLGAVKFAWQAGANDSKTRVLHVKTSTSSGTDSGYAYFGFGPSMSSTSVGDIGGMCCNWAGPGGTCMSGTYNTTKVQGQSISRSSTSGVFTASSSKITYAPTNSCDHTPATTFKYGTTTQWGSSGTSVTAANVTNDLIAIGSLGDIGTLTSPTEL